MVERGGIVVFSLVGRTQAPRERRLGAALQAALRRRPRVAAATGQGEGPPPKAPAVADDSDPVRALNEAAKEIAREIEQELMALLPPDPFVSVQAELRFRPGSIVMLGTLAVLSWTGSIVLETMREQLAEVVKIAVQRVVGEAVAQVAPGLPPMQCSVTERTAAVRPAQASNAAAGRAAPLGLSRPGWRELLLLLLTLAVLVLILDRFFAIEPRSATLPPPAPPATARPSP